MSQSIQELVEELDLLALVIVPGTLSTSAVAR